MASRIMLHRRYPIATMAAAITLSAIGLTGALWACADSSCAPDWQLASSDYDCGGNAAINPGNDTRINLLLLMRSLRPVDEGSSGGVIDPNDPQLGRTFMTWSGLRNALWPQPAPTKPEIVTDGPEPTPVCGLSTSAEPAFTAAVTAESGLSQVDRAVLSRLRAQTGCVETWNDTVVSSKAGREYLAYLKAADAFYKNDWPAARQGFASLTRARSNWVAETAQYMPIRIGLRAAVATSVDEYGDFAGPEKADPKALADAREAIAAYLKSYPKGRYAASAQGLTRRVAWLSGDMVTLTGHYEALLANTPGDDEAAADLAEEIDIKLLERRDADAIIDQQGHAPLLLAVVDLKRMRRQGNDPLPLTASDLMAQKARFAAHADLYGLLQASRAYYAGDNPSTVIALLPDAARDKRFTPLTFSRQLLRGMALGQANDPNEAGFWRDLLTGASPRHQRPLVEMGLAIRWQRDGRLDQIFAPGSPITDTTMRAILLQTVATPTILRTNAKDAGRPARERDIARFTLLYKDLTHGVFGDFAGDVALVPTDANQDAGLWDFARQDEIPVGVFRHGASSDGFDCPSIAQTAATLARFPKDAKARLCLGDFYRLNGFDGFGLFQAADNKFALGHGPDGFSGRAQSRSDIYVALIADKGIAAENRAYALYRAVMCYAPSGYNGCGGAYRDYKEMEAAQASKADRKSWFTELKQRYPDSRWAKSLRYYW